MAYDSTKVAAKAFKESEYYDKVRIEYSVNSAQLTLNQFGIQQKEAQRSAKGSPITVLELGAGTGKLTAALIKALRNTTVRLVASEPTESMAKVFQKNFPNVEFLSCRSETIPLPDSSVHLITAGNAAHFMCSPESYAEMNRVLAPGGGVGFLQLDLDYAAAPWYPEIQKMSQHYYTLKGVGSKFDESGADIGWHDDIKECGYFVDFYEDRSNRFTVPITESDALEHIMSYGAFNTCDETERLKIRDKVRRILENSFSGVGKVMTELPMQTVIFFAKKKTE